MSYGYDMELGKTRIPSAFHCLSFSNADTKEKAISVVKMMLRYPKLGPVDFSWKNHLSDVGNDLHCAIYSYNVPMVELTLDHCSQDYLASDSGKEIDIHLCTLPLNRIVRTLSKSFWTIENLNHIFWRLSRWSIWWLLSKWVWNGIDWKLSHYHRCEIQTFRQ